MKATELMIGDWVLDGKKPAQMTGIFCDDLFETTFSPSVGGECISPIPLTREILEKNGWFPLDEYRYEGDIALAKGRNGFRLKNTTICINSVHQLQHALRLCGIDKEIEI